MKKFKMDPKKKKIWIEALRSGKYKQGFNKLKNEVYNSYCCLGVARAKGLCKQRIRLGENKEFVSYKFLPENVQDKLANMNDYKYKSFIQIANWIEKNL